MFAYKHYSFDLWLTLIRSNPMFKKQRSQVFYEQFNMLKKPLTEVEHAFRQVDIMCNNINEATGKNIDAEEMYLMTISLINDNKISLQDIDIVDLYTQMENLVFEYLPMIYCERTSEVLAFIKDHSECTTNLLSNTGFIKGITLRKVLKQLSIDQYFDFQLYSDEVGLSKPNQDFFQLMIKEALSLQPVSLKEIIHIGDNPKADIWGADMAGISSLQINSNDTSIIKLIPNVTQHLFSA